MLDLPLQMHWTQKFFFIDNIRQSKLNKNCNKGYGGIKYWVGDGFCDDINNNEACGYDNGDCCGLSMEKNFCVQCICKGKSNSFKMTKEI